MSHDFSLVFPDGEVDIDLEWLKKESLYFKNNVAEGDVSLRDVSFRREVCQAELHLYRDRRVTPYLEKSDVLLAALQFLDKYLFRREDVIAALTNGDTEHLKKVRAFCYEHKTPYSRGVYLEVTQKIEEIMEKKVEVISFMERRVLELERRVELLHEENTYLLRRVAYLESNSKPRSFDPYPRSFDPYPRSFDPYQGITKL